MKGELSMTRNIILITGASSGIGLEFLREIDNHFMNIEEIWIVARNRMKLQEISDRALHKVRVIAMDITKDAQLERLQDMLEEKKAVVRILISCAGYGITGNFTENMCKLQLGMIRLNCEALTNLTYRLLPYMRKNSRIIQIASAAAFLPQPGFAVYAATKAYVHSFSRAIGAELRPKQIYVTSVCPGPVDTPFFEVANQVHTDASEEKINKLKHLFMIQPDKVAKQALRDSYHKRPVSVIGFPITAFAIAAKILPHGLLLKILTKK
jgi:short-subunit dehydrogenase